MFHWLEAVFSLPQGHVSELTSRLPSSIAYIVLIGVTLFFFGERIKFQEAFIASLLLLTCFEIHRAGMTARVDMLLTTFIVCGLYALYWWEDHLELNGLPLGLPLLLGCAVLTKGPVGLVLPLFVFAIYLLILGKYRLGKIIKALLYAGIASSFLPLIWYVAAWQQGGDAFLDRVLYENFGRFFSSDNSAMAGYELGHENGVWYNFMTVIAGFIPWTALLLFSLFGLNWKSILNWKPSWRPLWQGVRNMDKIKLFSLVAIIGIFIFYSVPASKRSVYLMPAYPFIALFIAQYFLNIATYRTTVVRVFAAVMAFLMGVIAVFAVTSMTIGSMKMEAIIQLFITNPSTLRDINAVTTAFANPDAITVLILLLGLISFGILAYQMSKKIQIKILYASIAAVFALNLCIDGIVMRNVRNAASPAPFAAYIQEKYAMEEDFYVMNNLNEYLNLYGLNFYLGNGFRNFEKEQPENCLFIVTETDAQKVIDRYGSRYAFHLLETSGNIIGDVRRRVCLYKVFLRAQVVRSRKDNPRK
jgi:4-amino-4-deoxy-L-arabinose transferase-like glycosyltransferase